MAAPPVPPFHKVPIEVLNMNLDEVADAEDIIKVVFDRNPEPRKRRIENGEYIFWGISMRGLASISSTERR
jgi:hypothetical protein